MANVLNPVGKVKKEYFGLRMYELVPELQPKVTSTFTTSKNEKLVLVGILSLDRHENSNKFEDEVVVSVWSRDPPYIEQRAFNDGYFRLEIPVKLETFVKLMEACLKRLWLLEGVI